MNKPKKNIVYSCVECDYHTSRKGNLKKHFQTLRHKKNARPNDFFVCVECGVRFSSRTSLWRHSQECKFGLTREELLRENMKLKMENKKKDDELIAKDKHTDVLTTALSSVTQIAQKKQSQTINNQIINQKISINVYLNEHCKDALNLQDFVRQITLSFEDLQRVKEEGSVQSIGDLFVKHLTDLKPTQRPIHCSDKKRLKFYVKDDDKWEKDNKKIDDSIRKMNNKQHSKLCEWQATHPNWKTNEKESQEYMDMVSKIAWMSDDCQKNNDKIKRAIGSATEIKNIIK